MGQAAPKHALMVLAVQPVEVRRMAGVSMDCVGMEAVCASPLIQQTPTVHKKAAIHMQVVVVSVWAYLLE